MLKRLDTWFIVFALMRTVDCAGSIPHLFRVLLSSNLNSRVALSLQIWKFDWLNRTSDCLNGLGLGLILPGDLLSFLDPACLHDAQFLTFCLARHHFLVPLPSLCSRNPLFYMLFTSNPDSNTTSNPYWLASSKQT